MTSSGFVLEPSSQTTAGGEASGGGYALYGAVGQSVIGHSLGGSMQLCGGILCGSFSKTAAVGDINADGCVDQLDARLCLQIAEGATINVPIIHSAADIDGDGNVDRMDAEILAEYVIGMRQTLR